MGPDGAALCLEAGANDMGGVLMDESITRAAGAVHGQQVCAEDMQTHHTRCGPDAVAAHNPVWPAGQPNACIRQQAIAG